MATHKERIEEILTLTNGPVVLDLGCVQPKQPKNNKWWLHGHLHNSFETVIGVDSDFEKIHRLAQYGYDVTVQDVEKLNLDITADTIVIGELIEHLANPGQMLSRLPYHLKDNGQIIITTPNLWFYRHFLKFITNKPQINSDHTCWFDYITLAQLLERYDFTITYYNYVCQNDSRLFEKFIKYCMPFGTPILNTTLLVVAEYTGSIEEKPKKKYQSIHGLSGVKCVQCDRVIPTEKMKTHVCVE